MHDDRFRASRPGETYNPWSIVNLVFHHLADAGAAPGPRRGGDPGAPAAELLRALGIEPAAEGNRQANSQAVRAQLDELRAAVLGEPTRVTSRFPARVRAVSC